MRTLRCPRCDSNVQAPVGQAPVCPACGFGAPLDHANAAAGISPSAAPASAAQAADGAPPPAAHPDDATPLQPVPAAPRRTGMVVVSFAVALVLVAGAVAAAVMLWPSDPGALSQEESERRVEAALGSLPQALADGGSIRMVQGTMTVEDGNWIGPGSISFTMEWGKGGVVKVAAEADQPGFSMAFSMYCTPDRVIMVFGGQSIERRQAGDDCDILDETDYAGSPLAGIGRDGVELEKVTPHRDGTVTAVLVNGTERITLHLDAQGRVDRLQVDMDDGAMDMRFSHGARRTIDLPKDTVRAPAAIGGEGHWNGDTYTWEAWHGDPVPLSEFEVRAMDGTTRVATFALTSGTQSSNGITFRFHDDGDGMFGADDGFTITASTQYEIVVWDTWADRDVQDDVAVPGLHVAALLAALVILGAVVRRR